MKAFFGCSTRDIDKYKKYYRATISEIKKAGFDLTRDWVERSIRVSDFESVNRSRSQFFYHTISAIITADVVVFDCTQETMALGHQIAFAASKNKPILILAKSKDIKLNDLFIGGSSSHLVTFYNYKNEKDLKSMVAKYFNNQNKKEKIRFNCNIEKQENDYLEWAALNYNQNKTDLVRRAIQIQIDSDDLYRKIQK